MYLKGLDQSLITLFALCALAHIREFCTYMVCVRLGVRRISWENKMEVKTENTNTVFNVKTLLKIVMDI